MTSGDSSASMPFSSMTTSSPPPRVYETFSTVYRMAAIAFKFS